MHKKHISPNKTNITQKNRQIKPFCFGFHLNEADKNHTNCGDYLVFCLHSNLTVKKLQLKAIVFIFFLISRHNSPQIATALRMRLVRLLKRPPMRYFSLNAEYS